MSSSDSESNDSSADERPRGTQANIDFDSNDIKTIISDTVQYVITNSQKKLPIKKQSKLN